jgi:subtilisin family serine protease
MADTTFRLIIQASGSEALRLGAGQLQVQGVPFKVERLFKNRPAGAAFGISGSDWFLAEAEPSDKNPWDAAHDGVMNGFGIGLSPGFSYAEPDILHKGVLPYTTDEGMAALAAAPPCQFVPQDSFWPPAPSFTWFLEDQFSGLRSARNAVDHHNVRIGHVDTGYSDHVVRAKNLNTDLQWNFVEGVADAHDPGITGFLNQPGHGTGTQGILAGNILQGLTQADQNTNEQLGGAPDAEIVPIRVANSVLHFFTSALAQGFDYAIAPRSDASKRCDVVSLSMGGVPSKVWAEAVNRAYEAGVVIVAASGNNFTGGVIASVVYPARFNRVIAAAGIVADHSPYYRALKFSHMQGNFGPASKMKTTIAGYTTNMPWADRTCHQLINQNGEGTSSATPQVAAAAALWLAKHNPQYDQPWKRVEAVRHALFSSGDRQFKDSDKFYGNGAIRARAALDVAPLQVLTMTPADSVFLPILKEITGIGIAPGQMEMFHVEACQLLQNSETLNGVLEDPDVPVRDDGKIKQFMEALIAEKNSSQALRRYIEGEYALRYKTLPAGVPPPAPSQFPPDRHRVTPPEYRALRGYAFDPSLSASLATVAINEMTFQVRWEDALDPGPVGEYLEVIDYNSTERLQQPPVDLDNKYVLARSGLDPSEGNPQFHQQMTYAVSMTTIQNFERALGRPVLWAGMEANPPENKLKFVQRLRVYPHAMEQQNAYYSPSQRALLFGYFHATSKDPANQFPGGMTFTCLSHDIVAHETTHAILDGMHRRFGNPTNPDMLAFHEAFADIAALFQHFTFPEAVRTEIVRTHGDLSKSSLLAGLAQEFGMATGMRGALRSAIGKVPNPADYQTVMEPHERGALLVATIFEAFVAIYNLRTADLMRISFGELSSEIVERLSAEAARAARQVLDICIRALDYCPPVDITFGDYLRALVTADVELVPVDPAGYRLAFLEAFRQRGLYPLDVTTLSVESLRWQTADEPGSAARTKKVVSALRQYAEKCTYVTSRERLFTLTMEAREKMRGMILEIMKDKTVGPEALQTFGLDASDGEAGIEVHALRMAHRFMRDGSPVMQAIMEITQSRTVPIDPSDATMGTFEFIGGCTLVINLKKPNLDYVVVKNINAPNRLQRTRDYLRSRAALGMSAYAMQEPFGFLHGGKKS